MIFSVSFLRLLCGCTVASLCLNVSSAEAVRVAEPAAVQDVARSLKGRVGMAAVMLDTGESVAVGDETSYPMQSVVKFPLALSVLKRVDGGVLPWTRIFMSVRTSW